MAKCVTNREEIVRVSDERAKELVAAGWKYTSKGAWKSAGRPRE